MLARIQSWGGFAAGMVVPNIGAFIAWGLLTALFIPTGWLPNEQFSAQVGPMILNLLPILIGYTGGRMIHGQRGGIIGAVATMGTIVGSEIPQFLGGMIAGPLAAQVLKRVDKVIEPRVPIGFELLINNFALGISGVILTMVAQVAIAPFVQTISDVLGGAVSGLIASGLLPLVDLVVEPAKVLFLNNALNLGVLAPLGAAAAKESGKAIHFLLESNPGPGLGMLLAYWVAGKGLLKQSAPGAIVIHFFGGIHEIYFPYVLAHPIMLLAMYAGGIVADTWFVIFNAGLVAVPSPGSIFAYLAMTPPGGHFAVFGGVFLAVVAAFLVGSILLRAYPAKDVGEDDDDGEEESLGIPGLG